MGFLPSCGCVSATVWMHHLDSKKTPREKARWKLHNNATYCLEEILEAAPHKVATPHKVANHKSQIVEQDRLGTGGEVRTNKKDILIHMDVPMSVDQQGLA